MRTLVLNAGYEPLAVVSFKRAIVLVMGGKASIVAIDDGNPVGGTFQFSTYDGGGAGGVAPVGGAANQCYLGAAWTSATVDTNCGGSSLF